MSAALVLIALVAPASAVSSGQYPPWRGHETKAAEMMPSAMLQTDIAREAAADQELEKDLDAISKVSLENMEMQNRLKDTVEANKGFLTKKENADDLNPTAIAMAVGGVLVIVLVVAIIARSRSEGYKAFGDKSGLSTSSSDITSSETGSTDRELKSRMERFEKRLEEHKKMLESNSVTNSVMGSSSVTNSESKASSTFFVKK
eukprot:gnl/MRDRNA2_/MRDRNA2_29108_c0_seq1.p1 gnl/MRDRNA2_/MRDRNA2_29108_c0~~gnl/MRDRNA2_/MRDRNA2_29108_c0_seq1.p1  ORF type:complete len:203 (+),score=47.03 gnl/MRDRNA2_/MRDRNA2_29108_c0_seq1:98-706(+)